MKKNLIIITVFSIVFIYSVSASTSTFKFNSKNIFNNKNKSEEISDKFNSSYKLEPLEEDEQTNEYKELVRQATYYLLGPANNAEESAESYIKRKKTFGEMRYQPEIPTLENGELDLNSEEALDESFTSYIIPNFFLLIDNFDIDYKQFDNIEVAIVDDGFIGVATLDNIKMKVADEEKPKEFKTIEADLKLYYLFKEYKGEYYLYYMYGEYDNSLEKYNEEIANEEYSGVHGINLYDSKWSELYDFSNVNKLTKQDLQKIYNNSKNNIVIFNAMYDQSSIASANGMFINEDLVVTTWSYLEKALLRANSLTVKDANDNYLTIDGVVTIDVDKDLAVLKVSGGKANGVKFGTTPKVEDAVILISSKTGAELSTNVGITISIDNLITTTIPTVDSEEGAPLFNAKGEVIGMNNSNVINSSISKAYLNKYLIKLQEKFQNNTDVSYVPFDELKNSYYVKYGTDKVVNNIDEKVWNKYKKIGDLENSINAELIKVSYEDNVLSLRYKNNLKQFFGNMQLASKFINELKNDNYEELVNETNKKVYTNDNYRVTIMSEFNYLIIVIAGV